MDPTILLILLFAGFSLGTVALFLVLRDVKTDAASSLESGLAESGLLPSTPALDENGDIQDWDKGLFSAVAGQMIASPRFWLLLAIAGVSAVGIGLQTPRDHIGAVGGLAAIAILLVPAIWGCLFIRRREQYRKQVPEVVRFLSRSVRAGESIDQALANAGGAISSPMKEELLLTAKKLEQGLGFDAAMRLLTRRVPIREAKLMATALIVQRHSGGDLPGTLGRLADMLRERIRYRQTYWAVTSISKYSAALIMLTGIFVAAYMLMFRYDEVAQTLDVTLGRLLFGTAVVLEIVGMLLVAALLQPSDS